MSSEDRNFRYGYYEKVGFGGIEEKKSLEILLREKPHDLLARLSQLTTRYALSAIHRKQVWQLLLDVTSPDNRITQERIKVQREIARDIIEALELMSLADPALCKMKNVDYSPEGHPKLMVLIFLFANKQLESDIKHQFEKVEVKDLVSISEVFTKEFLLQNTPFTLEDTYWIYKQFISSVQTNFIGLIETYEKFIQYLANEDQTLHAHLVKNGIIRKPTTSSNGQFFASNGHGHHGLVHSGNSNGSSSREHYHHSNSVSNYSGLPFHLERQRNHQKYKILTYRPMITWFTSFFASIIHHSFLIRVFDKLIGCLIHGPRPFYVLISLGKALITYTRDQLLVLSTVDDITKRLLAPLSIDESEQIVTKALSNY